MFPTVRIWKFRKNSKWHIEHEYKSIAQQGWGQYDSGGRCGRTSRPIMDAITDDELRRLSNDDKVCNQCMKSYIWWQGRKIDENT